MRLPESQRCVVPVLKVEICSGISIDFIRSCGRICDFVGFLVNIIIAVRKQHCSALLFLAERRMLCTPVMSPFLSCQLVLYLVHACSKLFDFKLSCSLYTGCKNAAAKWYHLSLAQHFLEDAFKFIQKRPQKTRGDRTTAKY